MPEGFKTYPEVWYAVAREALTGVRDDGLATDKVTGYRWTASEAGDQLKVMRTGI